MTPLFSPRECRRILSLGIPIFLGALANTGMNFVDTVMAGRYCAEALAAVAVAASFFVPFVMFVTGCLTAIPGMTAQLVGAGRYRRACHLLRQGIFLSVAMACVLIPLLWACAEHLEDFGVGPDLAPSSRGYLLALLPGLAGALVVGSLRGFLEGFGRTRPGMVLGGLALLLNIPCNYAFIYGAFGMPELGAVGCGVATSICFCFTGLCLIIYIHIDPFFRTLRPLSPHRADRMPGRGDVGADTGSPWPLLDFSLIAFILRVGLPSACSLCVEVFMYTSTAILLAPLGAVVVAGHQITQSYSMVPFMIPVAIGATATIIVGQHLGARHLAHARTAATTTLTLGLGASLVVMAGTILFREEIAHIYNDNTQVLTVAGTLFLLCGTYQVVDFIQQIAIGILRGCNDTRTIMLTSILSYAVVGLPLCVILGRTDLIVPAMGATGFWIGYNVSMACAAICYLLRLRWLRRQTMGQIAGRLAQ